MHTVDDGTVTGQTSPANAALRGTLEPIASQVSAQVKRGFLAASVDVAALPEHHPAANSAAVPCTRMRGNVSQNVGRKQRIDLLSATATASDHPCRNTGRDGHVGNLS